MRNDFVKPNKLMTSISCLSLICISNNSELAAQFLPIHEEISVNNQIKFKNAFNNNVSLENHFVQRNSLLIAENGETVNNDSVLIAEIIIEGWEEHPEGRKLELAAYDSMTIKPGSIINNQILKKDLNAIYASGWFSGVKIRSQDGPLGVRLIVTVVPNPILKKVELNPQNKIILIIIINIFLSKSLFI